MATSYRQIGMQAARFVGMILDFIIFSNEIAVRYSASSAICIRDEKEQYHVANSKRQILKNLLIQLYYLVHLINKSYALIHTTVEC